MGLLARLFTTPAARRRKKRAERGAVAARIASVASDRGVEEGWAALRRAFDRDPESNELFRVAATLLRKVREVRLAELFDRAADAPHDPQGLLELGSALLTQDEARLAALVLTRALHMSPFDAVIRSELSLAHARSGRPEEVLSTLALHPCLADDPGALFEFGWASMLVGDLDAASGVLSELGPRHPLRGQLRAAIDRRACHAGDEPPDVRDFYFVEHGGLVLDDAGPSAGRYMSLTCDDAFWNRILANLRHTVRLMGTRQVVILDARHEPFARAVAEACGIEVVGRGKGRLPEGLVPLLDVDALITLDPHETRATGAPLLFVPWLDPNASLAIAPSLVGAFACVAEGAPPARFEPGDAEPGFVAFVEARRDLLDAEASRSHAAYVPDAPLPPM